MNKFIHPPDSLGTLLGCAIGMALLAATMALFLGTIYGLFAGGPR